MEKKFLLLNEAIERIEKKMASDPKFTAVGEMFWDILLQNWFEKQKPDFVFYSEGGIFWKTGWRVCKWAKGIIKDIWDEELKYDKILDKSIKSNNTSVALLLTNLRCNKELPKEYGGVFKITRDEYEKLKEGEIKEFFRKMFEKEYVFYNDEEKINELLDTVKDYIELDINIDEIQRQWLNNAYVCCTNPNSPNERFNKLVEEKIKRERKENEKYWIKAGEEINKEFRKYGFIEKMYVLEYSNKDIRYIYEIEGNFLDYINVKYMLKNRKNKEDYKRRLKDAEKFKEKILKGKEILFRLSKKPLVTIKLNKDFTIEVPENLIEIVIGNNEKNIKKVEKMLGRKIKIIKKDKIEVHKISFWSAADVYFRKHPKKLHLEKISEACLKYKNITLIHTYTK